MTKTNLNTSTIDIFSGTYYTQWEITEYDDNGNELEVEYDFNDFMRSIVEAYQDKASEIVKILGIDWIKNINFTGSHSPREYNFSTDTLDFTLTINQKKMIEQLKTLEKSTEFAKFLKENYTSCDGFWSWTPNNYKDLLYHLTHNGDEYTQALGALVTYLAGKKTLKAIEQSVFDSWYGNGYGGCNYTV